MKNSSLFDHKFKKGKFITPWNDSLGDILKDSSWFRERLPEYVWLGLILDYYDRDEGLEKCYFLIKRLSEIVPELLEPRFSEILKFEEKIQEDFFQYTIPIIDKEVLSPLTCIYTYSKFPTFTKYFCISNCSVVSRLAKLLDFLKKASDHQSYISTDMRFLIVYTSILSGRYSMPKDTLDLILEYPTLSHENDKMCLIRPLIRSSEISALGINNNDDKYLSEFWEAISKMSDCELMCPNFLSEKPNNNEYMEKVKRIMFYYTDLMNSVSPLDNKMLVILGIATYSYKRLLELVEHELYNEISGRAIARVLIEDYIMLKYLLKNESAHKDIWSEFQYYGIGQYKLIVARFREVDKDLKDSHVEYKYLELLVNEYKDEEFINMDTSYFLDEKIRDKAISVDEKELYGLYYDYDSAFEHGLWGAIRESSLIKCNSIAHQYHCVPDIDNNQKLKTVWYDCARVMNMTLGVLEDVYGLPAHLKMEMKKADE